MSVSFQLYSSRDVASQSEFLSTLSGLGYDQVEGYGGVYGDPAAFRAAMEGVGMTMPSGHFGLADLEADLATQLAIARTLGMRQIYAPHLAVEDRPTDSKGYSDFAHRLNTLAHTLKDEGFEFGWHNHDFELAPLDDGGIPLDILLSEAPDISWEGDLAWLIRAGVDALDWIARFGSRLSAVHVKDLAKAGHNLDQDGWADLGEGTIDWAALCQATKAVAPDALMIMEHDKPADAAQFAATSITHFKTY